MIAKNKPNEIYICRTYNASVKDVWEAWVDPIKVAKWWGPRGFTLTSKNKDVRAGGSWVYTMHGPDGVDYPNITKFLEVEKYSRLVYDHGGNENQPPMFRVSVEFTEIKGKTKLEMSMAFPSPEIARETGKFIKQVGGNSTWDRLSEFLDKESTGKEKFVINRSFNAPMNLMFKMWTDPNHISKWLAPTGSTMEFIRADIKTGGNSFYLMTTDTGVKMYGRIQYTEISSPNKLVYTQEFCDEKENLSRHPMAPTWPATMFTTVNFNEEGPDQTRVTIEWECFGKFTAEELSTFIHARSSMTQGWTGSFDKLEDYLTKM